MEKYIYFGFVGLLLISLAFVYKGRLWPARAITPLAAFLLITRLIYGGGIHDDALGGYYFILIVAGLMIGQRALLVFGVMSAIAVVLIGVAETSGLINTRFGPLTEQITIATTAIFILGTTLALNYLVVRLNRSANDARRNEIEQIKANKELRELQSVLEERVEQRTAELDLSNQQLMVLQEKLKQEAIHDPLTGLYNRRHLDEFLPIELARSKRANSALTVLMLDIDHFKNINDTYGHQIGDAVLQGVGNSLKKGVRPGDIVCRYGGEEFLLVFPGMQAGGGQARAESIRAMIGSQMIKEKGHLLSVTISIGGSVYPKDGNSDDELIAMADLALYRAKQNGRNRVEFARPKDHASRVTSADV